VLHVDAEVKVGQLTFDAARRIQSLAPFGMDFAEPLFLARGLILRRISPIGDGRHARFGFQAGDAWMDAIYFRVDPALVELSLGSRVDAVFHLQLHEWNGSYKVQAGLRDWRPA
jgi:single-stranded-DNA-specific exonuclease